MFRDNQIIESIVIPSTVTNIGDSAFRNSSLETIIFEAGTAALAISANAFRDTDDLIEIDIPARATGATAIGMDAFRDSGVGIVTFETRPAAAGFTVNPNAFWGTTNLTSIVFPDITAAIGIGADAFRDSGLTSVTMPMFGTVGARVFLGTPLASINAHRLHTTAATAGIHVFDISGERVAANGVMAAVTAAGMMGGAATHTLNFVLPNIMSLSIPYGITALAANAFDGHLNLQHIVFPTTFAATMANAFMNMPNLQSVTFPNIVTAAPTAAQFTSTTSATVFRASIAGFGFGVPPSIVDFRNATTLTAGGHTFVVSVNTEYRTVAAGRTASDPFRPGYNFEGWYDNADFDGTSITSLELTTATGTFFARWASL